MLVRNYTDEVGTLWYRAPEILLGQCAYTCPADMWSVGCIIAEIITSRPFLPGNSEMDQLYHIFRMFGTPDENVWPGVTSLPDYKPYFPQWSRKDLTDVLHSADTQVIDLISKMTEYEPCKRISARSALEHSYFTN